MKRREVLIAIAVLLAVAALIGALVAVVRPGPSMEPLPGVGARTGTPKPTAAGLPPGAPALCGRLTTKQTGRVSDGALTELSGLVRSRRDPKVFWAIQDSGNAPALAALSPSGETLGLWAVSGATNTDWEDLAIGPGPSGPRLYIADIGDNAAQRDSVTIWVVDEPRDPRGGGVTAPANQLTVRYPGGPRDAETLLIDPLRGDVLIVSKQLTGGGIYAARAPLPLGGSRTLRRVASAPLGFETGGDVSADGRVVAVRGYASLAAWQRRGEEPLTRTLARDACISPTLLDDGQGEALALSRRGTTATTVAEGERPPLLTLRPASPARSAG